jgi:cytosol alanyl aminopeptidase
MLVRSVSVALVSFLSLAAQSPKLRLSEVQNIVPLSYRVELSLSPAEARFTGTVNIRIRIARPAKAVWLHAKKLTIEAVTVTSGGKALPAEPAQNGEDFLALNLPSTLQAGEADLTIRYSGYVREGETAGLFPAEDLGNKYLYTQFEATEARTAVPCFDEPSYKTPWQLTLKIPSATTAVTNTTPASDTVSGDTRTITFRQTKPITSYLLAFAVGPFEFVPAGATSRSKTPIRIVVPRGRTAEAKYAAEVTGEILSRLETYFGIPFPWGKSDQVAVPVASFGAMENPGAVTYAQNLILARPENDSINRQRQYATIAAHELAHQWFGDLMTTEWWDDIWLNEAFATWMEKKLIAEWKPEWNTRVMDVQDKMRIAKQDSLISARKIRQEIGERGDIANAFDNITYQKGASVIAMFETWMGSEVFRRGVQSFLRQYSYRTATAGDFLDALGSAAKANVGQSFSTYLNQPGLPVISISLDCARKPASLHLSQARYLPTGSKGETASTWNIPVCIRYPGSKPGGECKLMTAAEMDWPLSISGCPAWIDANDDAKGYYRVDYRGDLRGKLMAAANEVLTAAGRAELVGNVSALVEGGRVPIGEALRMVETLRHDPSRQVLEEIIGIAGSIDRNIVPDNQRSNYRRFIMKNFGERARSLGWLSKPGEPEETRLLRPMLVSNVARLGEDPELSQQARELAEKWLSDRKAIPADDVAGILSTAAWNGEVELFRRMLAEYRKSTDRQEKTNLRRAFSAFRAPAAIQAGLMEVASRRIDLSEGVPLLFGGQGARSSEKLAFEFIKSHWNELLKYNPSLFGFDLGGFLPFVGNAWCDAGSRRELSDFFTPIIGKYEGGARNLAQVLESIDLCVARTEAQKAPVVEFLSRY